MSTEEKDDRLETPITIPVRLDAATFRDFALFDVFVVKRHWIRPALFAALFVAFAAAALSLRKAQSGLIAAVLLAVGLGLPVVYAGSFLSQANAQARDRLDPSRLVYTVILETDGVRVEAPPEGRRNAEPLLGAYAGGVSPKEMRLSLYYPIPGAAASTRAVQRDGRGDVALYSNAYRG